MKSLLFPALLLSAFIVSAQDSTFRTITAKVVDAATQKPLKDMTVSIGTRGVVATTNVMGFFQVAVTATDTLTISNGRDVMQVVVPAQASSFKIPFMPPPFRDESIDLGGLYAYFWKTIRYPLQARRMGVEGAAVVYFELDTAGTILKKNIIAHPGATIDEELMKVLTEAPTDQLKLLVKRFASRHFLLPVTFGLDRKFDLPQIPNEGAVILEPIYIVAKGAPAPR